jgi:tight adherence protein C
MDQGLLLPLVAVFLSVALAAGMLAAYVLRRTSPVERRLRGFQDPTTGPARLSDLDLSNQSYGSLDKVSSMLPKSPKEMSRLRRQLVSAGIDRPEAAVLFALAELGLPLVLGGLTLAYLGSSGIIFVILAAVLGYLLPGLWLGQKMAVRKKEIQNGLPDALDLLLVSVEAGSGLDQALSKVGKELELAYPALAQEFRQIVTDIRAGRSRADALRAFADRAKVEDVRALVTTMIQTDKFGTSIGQALRTLADTARVKRRQRAEERAQKLGVKLVFPLALCLFPAMYVVVLGPAALRVFRMLGQQIGR